MFSKTCKWKCLGWDFSFGLGIIVQCSLNPSETPRIPSVLQHYVAVEAVNAGGLVVNNG